MTNRTRTDSLLLAGFCAFLFFYGLNQFGLIGADEPRYAQVAREMLARHDWITPTLGGQPWLEKPPLYYWQAMLAYSVFGANDWAARLPSAIDATFLVLAMYFFLRRFRPGFELDGALIAASCAGVTGYARAASTDMALAAAFSMGMLAWWAWRESGKKIDLSMFYLFIALGMLAKGPVAPLLSFLAILLYATAVRKLQLILKTLWLPGMILWCAIALPWYAAVQMRNPAFFHEFIIEHNLGRFSENLYHHTEPFWYYLPVAMLALIPWTAFAITAFSQTVRRWQAERKSISTRESDAKSQLGIFACCWLIAPVIFFSISQSKLPGYILPAIPAVALLLAEYLRHRLEKNESESVAIWLAVLHSLLASAPMVPALLIAYLLSQRRLPGGKPMLVALLISFMLCAGIALTLVRKNGLRMLRFVTLIPVVLTVGAVLKLGAKPMDEILSARPMAQEIAAIETHPLPLAVYHVRRELEYGLTFYRNHLTFNYDWGRVPQEEHLLVAPEGSQEEIAKLVAGRRVSYLGHYAAQHADYFWVAAAPHPTP
ncbi:MAG TPA: glycosyltransferase family 39 protein [Candidatus Aquilonibacter sp.]|jgi:4-amino-4-deoxy-L-arabinose transferase-like glycosyltransferase|nr:glycosyltransferase family 39 protein [Candidatus Aquilonibacter sp.]